MTARGGEQTLADHFLTRFADAYLEEVRDFVKNIVDGHAPRVSGEDGLKALAIAVAAEKSHHESKPVEVTQEPANPASKTTAR
jgi:myo-inositol 2-dehydrogenase/D-chiro-inositol 1-dehydrogenase